MSCMSLQEGLTQSNVGGTHSRHPVKPSCHLFHLSDCVKDACVLLFHSASFFA